MKLWNRSGSRDDGLPDADEPRPSPADAIYLFNEAAKDMRFEPEKRFPYVRGAAAMPERPARRPLLERLGLRAAPAAEEPFGPTKIIIRPGSPEPEPDAPARRTPWQWLAQRLVPVADEPVMPAKVPVRRDLPPAPADEVFEVRQKEAARDAVPEAPPAQVAELSEPRRKAPEPVRVEPLARPAERTPPYRPLPPPARPAANPPRRAAAAALPQRPQAFKPPRKKPERGDFMVAALGVTLALICALFPWYIFFNPEKFGVREFVFEGNRGTLDPSRIAYQPQLYGTHFTTGDVPMLELDFIPTATVRGDDDPTRAVPVSEQPFPADLFNFRLVHVANGRAMIEDEDGLWVVQPGSRLPDASQVASIEQRSGGWVLVTTHDRVVTLEP